MKVVPHPVSELDQHLADFETDETLRHLCDAIALTLRYGIKSKKIRGAWDKVKGDLKLGTSDIQNVYRLLCLITSPISLERAIPRAPEPVSKDADEPNENDDSVSPSSSDAPNTDCLMSDQDRVKLRAALEAFAFETAQEQHDFFTRVFDDGNRYFFFTPAWEVEDHLPRAFPDENPGDVVADHLRVIFDQSDLEDQSLCVFVRPKYSLAEVGLVDVVDELCRRTTEHIECPQEKALFDGCIDAWTNGGMGKFHIFAMFLPYAPQSLFTLYLNLYPDWIAENEAEEALRKLSRAFLLDPAFYWTKSKWLRHKSRTRIIESWKPLLAEMRDAEASDENVDAEATEIVTTMYRTFGNRLVEISSSSKLESLPKIPPPLTWHIIACFHDYLVEKRGDLNVRLLKSYKKYRRQRRGGRIACPFMEMSWLSYATASGAGDANDLTIKLANLLTWGHDAADGGNQELPAFFGMRVRDSDEHKNWRFRDWQNLISSARKEGLHKFANALLSIFIFSQSLRYQGDIGNFQKLIGLVETARKRPGSEMVDRAVSIAKEVAEVYDNKVWTTYLGNIAYETTDYQISPVGPIDDTSEAAVTEELVNLLGEERWVRLCEPAREFLINAQQSYYAHRNLLFSGAKTQWGALALEYIKPLEAELNYRLRKVYFREDLAEFRTADKPTLGSYIEMLRCAENLSDEAQQAIAETTSVQTNRELLNRIDRIRTYHRNPGSHIDSYPPEKLDELRHQMFRKNLLGSFIDHLV